MEALTRDIWNHITQFLDIEDVKNLCLTSRQMFYNMRHIMCMQYRFIIDDLDTFRTLHFFSSSQNIWLRNEDDVIKLQTSDRFCDIILPPYFDFRLDTISWPSRLTHLTFGRDFNHPVGNLPKSLTHLKFGRFFNQPVDNLPKSLTHLIFGLEFNQPVDNLPSSLTHLIFEFLFDQSVDKLPGSLLHLDLGWEFNQPVDNLPDSLTHLEFGGNFHQPVHKLPQSLRKVLLYRHQLKFFPGIFRKLLVVK
jgi:hypothetical protein